MQDQVATHTDAMREYARNAGAEHPEQAWITTPWDVCMPNPHYTGPAKPHPESDGDDYGAGILEWYAAAAEYRKK